MTHSPCTLINQKPHYIGIGTRRCASSRTHELLSAHPEVLKPDRGQHYFSQNHHKGLDWYRQQFEAAGQEIITVDISVSQLYPELAEISAERIKEFSANPNLFAILRNPVKRAYSDYARSIMLCEIDTKLSFIDACHRHPEFIERSKYHKLLTPYWERFGVENIKLFYFEDMFSDPDTFFNGMAAYFGINSEPFLNHVDGETGHGHASKSPTLQRLILGGKSALRSGARKLGVETGWNTVTRTFQPVYQKMLRLNAREIKMSPQEYDYAYGLLKKDIDAFVKFVPEVNEYWNLT